MHKKKSPIGIGTMVSRLPRTTYKLVEVEMDQTSLGGYRVPEQETICYQQPQLSGFQDDRRNW